MLAADIEADNGIIHVLDNVIFNGFKTFRLAPDRPQSGGKHPLFFFRLGRSTKQPIHRNGDIGKRDGYYLLLPQGLVHSDKLTVDLGPDHHSWLGFGHPDIV